jgi:hypothetical protein
VRVLLDESLPRQLARVIPDHDVRTVVQMGWASIENGELLDLAVAAGFEAFVTADRNVEHQQNIARIGLGLVVLVGRSNRREHMMPLAPQVATALETLRPGQIIHVGTRRSA